MQRLAFIVVSLVIWTSCTQPGEPQPVLRHFARQCPLPKANQDPHGGALTVLSVPSCGYAHD